MGAGEDATIWSPADAALRQAGATAGAAPRMPFVIMTVRVKPAAASGAPPTVELDLALGPAALALDRRLAAGRAGGDWLDDDEWEAALVGDRPVAGGSQAFKTLRRLLCDLAARPGSTLTRGPDACDATMNHYAGVRRAEVTGCTASQPEAGTRDPQDALPAAPSAVAGGAGGAGARWRRGGGGGGNARARAQDAQEVEFDLGKLLESISTPGARPSASSKLGGLREDCALHPFQHDGISWMVAKETSPDEVTLHPAYDQFRAPDGTFFYQHRFTGEVTGSFYTAPRLETCGGMLCDDVGLGKSLQLLGLVLARPAPPGWAVPQLPPRTGEVLPIKGTLIVAPAALLPQWAAEIRKHCKPGALAACTYLGIGAAAKKKAANHAGAGAGGMGAAASARGARVAAASESGDVGGGDLLQEWEEGSSERRVTRRSQQGDAAHAVSTHEVRAGSGRRVPGAARRLHACA